MKNFLQGKNLIECRSNSPYDEVCDALVLDFIKQESDEKFLCKVTKDTSFKETWKILEANFGTKESGMHQQDVSQSVEESIEKELQI